MRKIGSLALALVMLCLLLCSCTKEEVWVDQEYLSVGCSDHQWKSTAYEFVDCCTICGTFSGENRELGEYELSSYFTEEVLTFNIPDNPFRVPEETEPAETEEPQETEPTETTAPEEPKYVSAYMFKTEWWVENCTSLEVSLDITEYYYGDVYGLWGFWVRAQSGEWILGELFELDENSKVLTVKFDEPVTFDAWALPCYSEEEVNFAYSAWLRRGTAFTAWEQWEVPFGTVICSGTDKNGNLLELVAKESASGKISLGVMRNREWIRELSDTVPFLGKDKKFHLTGEESTGLDNLGQIMEHLYYVDAGGFLLEAFAENEDGTYRPVKILYSGEQNDFFVIESEEWSMMNRHKRFQADSSGMTESGVLYTRKGHIVLYADAPADSGAKVIYKVINTQTLETEEILK